jgi:hypothetical protein
MGALHPGSLAYSVRMRVIVTDDRTWHCDALASRVVDRLVARYGRDELVIVHGAGTGGDSALDRAAIAERVTREPHPAEWDRLGRRARGYRPAPWIRWDCSTLLRAAINSGRRIGLAR